MTLKKSQSSGPEADTLILGLGSGVEGCASEGDPLLDAMLTAPTALAFDSDDNLYISDLLCGSILRVAQGAPTVSIFASGLQPAGFDFDF